MTMVYPKTLPSFESLVIDLAIADVRAGVRDIPGFTIIEQKVAI